MDKTDWSQFLQKDSRLPTDVVFKVIEDGTKEDEKEQKTGLVPAHKFLLSGVSTVFWALFFGELKSTTDQIDIKEAFTAMINFIYKPTDLKSFTCPQTLFQILNLSERYQIDSLKESISMALKVLEISGDSLMFTAKTAKDYEIFTDVSKMLTNRCGSFLKNKLSQGSQGVCDLLHYFHSSSTNTQLLIELLRVNGQCPNCKKTSNLCLDSKDVTSQDWIRIRNGLMVSRKGWTPENCDFACATSPANSDIIESSFAFVDGLTQVKYKTA